MSNRIWLETDTTAATHLSQAALAIDYCRAILRIHREAGMRSEKGLEGLRRLEFKAAIILGPDLS